MALRWVCVALAVVAASVQAMRAGTGAMDAAPPRAPASAMRFSAHGHAQGHGHRAGVREQPDWWHYVAPWWSPPTDKTTEPPDFMDEPAYSHFKEPPAGTMPVYVPNGRDAMSWVETGAHAHTNAHAKAKTHAKAHGKHGAKKAHAHAHRPVRHAVHHPQAPHRAIPHGAPRPTAMPTPQQIRAPMAGPMMPHFRQMPSSAPMPNAAMGMGMGMRPMPMPMAMPSAYAPLSASVYANDMSVTEASLSRPRFSGSYLPSTPAPQLPPLAAVPSASDFAAAGEFSLPSSLRMMGGVPETPAMAMMAAAQQQQRGGAPTAAPMPPPPGTPEAAAYAVEQERFEEMTDAEYARRADDMFGAHARAAQDGAPVPRIWRVDRPIADRDEDRNRADAEEDDMGSPHAQHARFATSEEGYAAAEAARDDAAAQWDEPRPHYESPPVPARITRDMDEADADAEEGMMGGRRGADSDMDAESDEDMRFSHRPSPAMGMSTGAMALDDADSEEAYHSAGADADEADASEAAREMGAMEQDSEEAELEREQQRFMQSHASETAEGLAEAEHEQKMADELDVDVDQMEAAEAASDAGDWVSDEDEDLAREREQKLEAQRVAEEDAHEQSIEDALNGEDSIAAEEAADDAEEAADDAEAEHDEESA